MKTVSGFSTSDYIVNPLDQECSAWRLCKKRSAIGHCDAKCNVAHISTVDHYWSPGRDGNWITRFHMACSGSWWNDHMTIMVGHMTCCVSSPAVTWPACISKSLLSYPQCFTACFHALTHHSSFLCSFSFFFFPLLLLFLCFCFFRWLMFSLPSLIALEDSNPVLLQRSEVNSPVSSE